jgi:hypothetical protein
VEPLTGGAGLSGAARACAAGPLGPGEERGKERARCGLGQNRPSRGGRVFLFSFFYFLFLFFHFLFLFLFMSFSFESIIC